MKIESQIHPKCHRDKIFSKNAESSLDDDSWISAISPTHLSIILVTYQQNFSQLTRYWRVVGHISKWERFVRGRKCTNPLRHHLMMTQQFLKYFVIVLNHIRKMNL